MSANFTSYIVQIIYIALAWITSPILNNLNVFSRNAASLPKVKIDNRKVKLLHEMFNTDSFEECVTHGLRQRQINQIVRQTGNYHSNYNTFTIP
jgi:hypothetical protein